MLWLIPMLIAFILIITHCLLRYSRKGRLLAKIPGPPGWPILGNLVDAWTPTDQLWKNARKLARENYPFYKILIGPMAIVSILEPENAEILLTSTQHIEKSSVYRFLHCWFGTGLLTSTGTKWQKRRKILTPAFHFNVLQKYLAYILENDTKAVKYLQDQGESVQNLFTFLTNYTLNVICEAAMGASLQGKEESQKKYRKAVYDMGDFFVYRMVRPWLNNPKIFNMTTVGRKQMESLKVLHGFSSNIIEERKAYHEKTEGYFLKNLEFTEDDTSDEVYGYRKKRLAMLDLLIAAHKNGKQIDDEGICEEVDTFIFAGHDTSAIALCFAFLLIAEHKDVQERIRSEVNEVLDNSGGKLGMHELQQLNYLERCVKESLRLYPSVPFISRSLDEDLQLKDYVVPKGVILVIHIFEIHRDPQYWLEPDKFDPDRFLPERIQGRHPFSYIPFSAGPRNCIGQKFAMMELKALIAHIIRNFYLEPVDFAHEVPIILDIVLRPARPVHIKFIPIQKS